MTRLLLRVVLSALAFLFVLPHIGGIQFHGNFVEAVGIGAGFALLTWLVGRIAAWLSAIFAVGTLGLGLLIVVPLWLFGFWALPGIALKVLADLAPAYLSVPTWGAALVGGLVMFFINLFTAEPRKTVVVVRKSDDER